MLWVEEIIPSHIQMYILANSQTQFQNEGIWFVCRSQRDKSMFAALHCRSSHTEEIGFFSKWAEEIPWEVLTYKAFHFLCLLEQDQWFYGVDVSCIRRWTGSISSKSPIIFSPTECILSAAQSFYPFQTWLKFRDEQSDPSQYYNG